MIKTLEAVCLMDIDGVVYPFDRALALVASEHLGRPETDFPPSEVWDFMSIQWGLTWPEYKELLNVGVREHHLFERDLVIDNAVEGWKTLREMGWFIHVVSHLETRQAQSQRLRWLQRMGLTFDDITFTGDKAPVAKLHLARGTRRVVAVDDMPKNVEEYASVEGVETYLVRRPWNSEFSHPHEVADLVQFATTLRAPDQA